ncbi:MAG: MOSC N-terminal beta barrel domain-containing protein, partial [Acidobacteriota bacterium]
MIVGKILEIWRYPVKSMAGERLDSCTIESMGIPGDRGWALRDEKAGEIRGAKHMPKLMECASRYRTEPKDGKIPHVDITLPDGSLIGSDQNNINSVLSALLGRQVTLWPIQPASNKAHYRRAQAGSFLIGRISRSQTLKPYIRDFIRYARLDGKARELFSREADEPLPDFSILPSELFEFTSPLGTYFDAFPIH